MDISAQQLEEEFGAHPFRSAELLALIESHGNAEFAKGFAAGQKSPLVGREAIASYLGVSPRTFTRWRRSRPPLGGTERTPIATPEHLDKWRDMAR